MTTQAEIAKHLNVSTRYVRELIAAGILPKGGGLDECRAAYLEHLRERAAGRGASGDLELGAERARLARLQGDKLELELAEKNGDLVPISEVEAGWKKLVLTFRNQMLLLPQKVADELGGDEARIMQVLNGLVREALQELSGWQPSDNEDPE
jgi:phage terminase Nu1 subunit (DNA packaging protein)